jgi:hypothetical protein
MKPKNFPEKKNQRRKEALKRLKKSAMKNSSTSLERAIENTEDKIVEDARAIRTKIMRTKV